MGFVFLEPIEKAKGKAFARGKRRLLKKVTPGIQASLIKGMKSFKNKAQYTGLLEALEKGVTPNINKLAQWDKLTDEFKELEDSAAKIIESSAIQSSKSVPIVLKPLFEFSPENPRIKKWIKKNTAKNVTALSKESKKAITSAIKEAVSQSLKRGLPPRKTAQIIKASGIGLNDRQQTAMINFQFKLMDQGVTGVKLKAKVDREFNKKLKARTLTIARTEGMEAVNQGNREMWNQFADKGLVDLSKTKKKWHTAPQDNDDPCTDMDQKVILATEAWDTELGTFDSPPIHPNCNCSEEMIPALT